MRKFYIIFALIVLGLLKNVDGQTFNCYIANDSLTSANQFEFEVYIQSTSTTFSLRTLTFVFSFNPGFISAGTVITPSLVPGFSQMNNYNGQTLLWSSVGSAFQVSSNTGVSCQTGTIVTTTTPMRIAKFKLVSTLPFNCAPSNISILRISDPLPTGLTLTQRTMLSSWTDLTCINSANSTISQFGTYTSFITNTLLDQLINMKPRIRQMISDINLNQTSFTINASPQNYFANLLSYQWLSNGVQIIDGITPNGIFSGSNSLTLTITNPSTLLYSNLYSVAVTQCNTILSSAVTLFDDNNICTIDSYDQISNVISHTNINFNDNNPCTIDACDSVNGVSHITPNNTDNNLCTIDICDPSTGLSIHNLLNINDTNQCTIDACDAVTGLITHALVDIDDINVCTFDNCDTINGNISHVSVNPNDFNLCTIDVCDPINGISYTPVNINDGNPSTVDFCDPFTGIISHLNVNASGYPDTTIICGDNVNVIPIAAPIGYSKLTAICSSGFSGLISINPTSGIVSIINAKPSGVYLIKIFSGVNQLGYFSINVLNNKCSNTLFDSGIQIPISSATDSKIGDFNNDGNQDFISANSTSNNVSVRLGNGLGAFTSMPDVNIGIGTNPKAIVVGDFNGDGNFDFATANTTGNTVSIKLGDGTGLFSGTNSIGVGSSPNSISIGDFNNDGSIDLVTSNSGSNNISIRFGDGTGNFNGSTNILVGTNPCSVIVEDFNRDGNSDIIVANTGSSTLSVILGNGLGNFTNGALVNLNLNSSPRSIAMGDFNLDGKIDLVIAYGTGLKVGIRLGDGTGGFMNGTDVNYPTGGFSSVLAGDFNGDGFLDYLVANSATVYLNLGNGLGGFGTSTVTIIDRDIISAVADFNNDGRWDVIQATTFKINIYFSIKEEIEILGNNLDINDGSITTSSNNNTDFGTIYSCNTISKTFEIRNNGLATLTINNYLITGVNSDKFIINAVAGTVLPGNSRTFTVNFRTNFPGLFSATVHIINSDCLNGDFDFVVQGTGGNVPSIGSYPDINILNGGNRNISPISGPINLDRLSASTSANFSGIITANPITGQIQITNAQPSGVYLVKVAVGSCILQSFTMTVSTGDCNNVDFIRPYTPSISHNVNSVVLGDFNNDNKQDMLSMPLNATLLTLHLGNGNGGFVTSTINIGVYLITFSVGDFNLDGNLDIVGSSSNKIIVYNGDGLGGFSLGRELQVQTSYIMRVSDFNNDGFPDVVVPLITSLVVYFGDGLGGFINPITVFQNGNPYRVLISDFNNDGSQDLIFQISTISNAFRVCMGFGNGTFASPVSIVMGSNIGLYSVTDFNSDGNQDLAVLLSGANTIAIRLGDGLGGFTSLPNISVSNQPIQIETSDYNSDGKQDIMVGGSGITLLLGNGLGGFNISNNYFGSTNITTWLKSCDFTNDGKIDLFCITFQPSQISVFTNSDNEINLQSNSMNIPDGNSIVSVNNNTNYNNVFTNTQLNKSYVIQNTGSNSLLINSISVTGTNASDFIITGFNSNTTISPNSNSTFNITFTPSGLGIRNATVHIINSDCSESDYDFLIQGNGIFNCSVNLSDANVCTFDACDSNSGISHTLINLDDGNVCTIDACHPVNGITHVQINVSDGNTCTNDICDPINGVSHSVINIDDNNVCTIDACNPASGISHIQLNIDDNDVCTLDNCDNIIGSFHTHISISDGNECTFDQCDPLIGISHDLINVDDTNAFTVDGCDPISGIFHSGTFIANLFIEGYYTGNGLMDNFGHGGTLNILGISNDITDVDSVLLTLMDPLSFQPVETSIGKLKSNGNIVFIFPNTKNGIYYLKINHRNSIETWSAIPVMLSTTNQYDFTTSNNTSYGSNLIETFDHHGWAIYNGDITNNLGVRGFQDGVIGLIDYNSMEIAINFTYEGYVPEDLTGDGIVESADYVQMENNYFYMILSIHP